MLLDTGATLCVVPTAIARAIGHDPKKSRRRMNFPTASGVLTAPVIVMDYVSALGYTVQDVEAACRDFPPPSTIDGLLGLSFLRHFRLEIDFRSDRIEIEHSEAP